MDRLPEFLRQRPRRHSFYIPRPRYSEESGLPERTDMMASRHQAPARLRRCHKEEEIFEIPNNPCDYNNISKQYDKQKERESRQPEIDISLITVHYPSKLAPPLEAEQDMNDNLLRWHIEDNSGKETYSAILEAILDAPAEGPLHTSSPGNGAVQTDHDEDHEMLEACTSKVQPIDTNMPEDGLQNPFTLNVLGLEDPFLTNDQPATNATAGLQNGMNNGSNLDSFNQTILDGQFDELINNITRNTTQAHHPFEELSRGADSAVQLSTTTGLPQDNLQSRQATSEEDLLNDVLQAEIQDRTSDNALLIEAGRALLQSRFHSTDDSFPDRRTAMAALKRLVKNPKEIEKWLNHKVNKAREEQERRKHSSPKMDLGYDPWASNLSELDEKREAERCAEVAVEVFDSAVVKPLEEDFRSKNREWRDDYAFFMAREKFDAEWEEIEREEAASFTEDVKEHPQLNTDFNAELDIDAEWAEMEENQKGENMPQQVVLPVLKEVSMDNHISTENLIRSDSPGIPMDIDDEDFGLIEVISHSSNLNIGIPNFQTPNLDILNNHPPKRIKLSTETDFPSLSINNTILQTQVQPIFTPSKNATLEIQDTSAKSFNSFKTAGDESRDTQDIDSEDEVSMIRTSPIRRPEEESLVKKDTGKASSFKDKSNKNIFGTVERRNEFYKYSPTPGSTWSWGPPPRIAPRPSIPTNAPTSTNNGGHNPGFSCHNRRHSIQVEMSLHSPSLARSPVMQSFANTPGAFQHPQGFVPNQGRSYHAPYLPGNPSYQYSSNNYHNQPSSQRRHMRHSSMDSARGGLYHQPQSSKENLLMGPMSNPRNPRNTNRGHRRNTSLGSQYSSPGAMHGSPEFTHQGSPTPLPGPRTGSYNFTPLPTPSLTTVSPVKFHMRSSPANSLARETVVATFDTIRGRQEGIYDIEAAVMANPEYETLKMVADFDETSKSVTVTGPAGSNIRGFVARHCKNVELTVKMV